MQEFNPFPTHGRLGRAGFFIQHYAWNALMSLAMGVSLLPFFAPPDLPAEQPLARILTTPGVDLLGMLLFCLFLILDTLGNIAITTRRLNDLDQAPENSLLILAPILNHRLYWHLCITPGTPGPNQHGPTP